MAGIRLILTLPLLLVIAASTQADTLLCYQCEDCEAKENYENSLKSCPLPAPVPLPAPMEANAATTAKAEANKKADVVAKPAEEANTAAITTAEFDKRVAEAKKIRDEAIKAAKQAAEDETKAKNAAVAAKAEAEKQIAANPPGTEAGKNLIDAIDTANKTAKAAEEAIKFAAEKKKEAEEANKAYTKAENEATKAKDAEQAKAESETAASEAVKAKAVATTKPTEAIKDAANLKSSRRKRAAEPESKIAKCVKVVFKDGEKTRINRRCSYENQSVDDKTRCANQNKGTAKQELDCQVCEEDNCNSAIKFTVASLPIVMGLILNFI